MFQRFTRTVHQIHFRTWPHVELKRFFTVSVASGVWQPPETRQNDPYTWKNPETRHREYLRFKERYKTDATFRTKIQLRVRTRTQARRALLNEEEEHKRILTERFRQWLKLRLEKGGLPDWETHVPEVVDGSMVRRCVSCGRVHYKGCTKIWWKNKQDVQYEVYEVSARKICIVSRSMHIIDLQMPYPFVTCNLMDICQSSDVASAFNILTLCMLVVFPLFHQRLFEGHSQRFRRQEAI
jgi:hypothetical protein